MIHKKKILVTGGRGYIGSELIKQLAAADYEPISFDIKDSPNFDILDPMILDTFVGKADFVFHLASPCIVKESVEKPWLYWNGVYKGTNNVVECVASREKKMIFTSTQLAADRHICPHCSQQKSPYASAKREAEKLVRTLGMDGCIIRLPNIYDEYGLDTNESRLYPRLNKEAREKGTVTIYRPDTTQINLINVEDCARMLIESMENFDLSGGSITEMFGVPKSIGEIAHEVAQKHRATVNLVERT